ncbi:MAG: methylenetetrahydrofolate reductase, partial [Gordonibacter urolithinfaciens]
MRSVSDIYAAARAAGRQPVSFEIFPPKGDLTLETAHEVAAELADLLPDFVSVTYSAGGSGNRQATADASEAEGPFRFAKDLVMRLADEGFCVGAAAYPEGHIECTDFRASVAHLKQKQDAGACFFVTQLFFDNAYFYRFREAADAAGITVPIACGVMPFLGKAQIQRMVFMCGASLPSPIIKLLAKYE